MRTGQNLIVQYKTNNAIFTWLCFKTSLIEDSMDSNAYSYYPEVILYKRLTHIALVDFKHIFMLEAASTFFFF